MVVRLHSRSRGNCDARANRRHRLEVSCRAAGSRQTCRPAPPRAAGRADRRAYRPHRRDFASIWLQAVAVSGLPSNRKSVASPRERASSARRRIVEKATSCATSRRRACWTTGDPSAQREDDSRGIARPGWWRASSWRSRDRCECRACSSVCTRHTHRPSRRACAFPF